MTPEGVMTRDKALRLIAELKQDMGFNPRPLLSPRSASVAACATRMVELLSSSGHGSFLPITLYPTTLLTAVEGEDVGYCLVFGYPMRGVGVQASTEVAALLTEFDRSAPADLAAVSLLEALWRRMREAVEIVEKADAAAYEAGRDGGRRRPN